MAFPTSPNLSRWRAGLWSGCWIALLAASLGCTSPNPTEVLTEPNPAVTTQQAAPEGTADQGIGPEDSALNQTPQPDPSGHGIDALMDPAVGNAAVDHPLAEDPVINGPAADRPAVENETDQRGNAASAAASDLGQQLPITAKTILGGEEIFLEVAETPTQQAIGLMYRPALPDDRGMVFPMNRPRPVRFWMMNVPVALDMLFVYQGQIQYIAAEVPPCPVAPCPTYGPDHQLVDHVIELRSGRAEELGVQVGDAVEIFPLE